MGFLIMKTLVASILFAATAQAVELPLSFTDNSDNESGFIVERKEDGGEFVQLLTLEANVTKFVDPDVPLGKTVTWRVYAWNEYGDSGFSNQVAEITIPPIGPDGLKINKGNPLAKFWRKLRGKKKRS